MSEREFSARDGQRLGQVAAGGVQVAGRQLAVAEVAEHMPDLKLVTGLAEQPQRLGRFAGRARIVPRSGGGVGPGGQQATGQVRFSEAAGQAQA